MYTDRFSCSTGEQYIVITSESWQMIRGVLYWSWPIWYIIPLNLLQIRHSCSTGDQYIVITSETWQMIRGALYLSWPNLLLVSTNVSTTIRFEALFRFESRRATICMDRGTIHFRQLVIWHYMLTFEHFFNLWVAGAPYYQLLCD